MKTASKNKAVLLIALSGLFAAGQLSAETIQVGGEGEAGYVFGSLEVDENGKAFGTLESIEGGEVYIEAQVAEGGEINGTDKEGNEYELEVD